MKRELNNILKKIIPFLIIVAIIYFIAQIQCARLKYICERTNVLLMILKDPDVLDAEILYDRGLFWRYDMGIRILFNDGGCLEIGGVDKNGKGDIRIHIVDDYGILSDAFNEKGQGWGQTTTLKMWSVILGFKVSSVTDLVRNHHLISQHVKNIPEISREYESRYVLIIDGNTHNLFKSSQEQVSDTRLP